MLAGRIHYHGAGEETVGQEMDAAADEFEIPHSIEQDASQHEAEHPAKDVADALQHGAESRSEDAKEVPLAADAPEHWADSGAKHAEGIPDAAVASQPGTESGAKDTEDAEEMSQHVAKSGTDIGHGHSEDAAVTEKVSPLQQVITMLRAMQASGRAEGERETPKEESDPKPKRPDEAKQGQRPASSAEGAAPGGAESLAERGAKVAAVEEDEDEDDEDDQTGQAEKQAGGSAEVTRIAREEAHCGVRRVTIVIVAVSGLLWCLVMKVLFQAWSGESSP